MEPFQDGNDADEDMLDDLPIPQAQVDAAALEQVIRMPCDEMPENGRHVSIHNSIPAPSLRSCSSRTTVCCLPVWSRRTWAVWRA